MKKCKDCKYWEPDVLSAAYQIKKSDKWRACGCPKMAHSCDDYIQYDGTFIVTSADFGCIFFRKRAK